MRKEPLKLAACAAALYAGLAGSQALATDIKLWTTTPNSDSIKAVWDKTVASYEAKNPGVTISVETRGTDEHKSAMRVAAQSSEGPDIYFMWAGLGLGGEFVNAGLSLPLDKYYDKYGWNDSMLGTALSFSHLYEGGQHGVPYTFRGEAIYYNKALFEKAGIAELPSTYDELKAAADKLKDAGIPAWTFGGSVNWHLMRLMDVILESKCGTEKHDQLKAMKLDWSTEPCATESFVDLSDWATNHILSPFMGIDHQQSFNLFMADRAAMMLEGNWLVGMVDEAGRLDDFDMFPAPTGTDRLYGFAGYFYVSTRSSHQDEAADFLAHLLSDEVQQEFLDVSSSISVSANVKYKEINVLAKKWMDVFAEYKEIYVNGDQAFPLDTTTEYFRVIDAVATGDIAPEDAGKAMQTFIDGRG